MKGVLNYSEIKTYNKVIVIQIVFTNRHIHQWNRIGSSKIDLSCLNGRRYLQCPKLTEDYYVDYAKKAYRSTPIENEQKIGTGTLGRRKPKRQ